jgi:geranylgeranyl diphosphate synthase type II
MTPLRRGLFMKNGILIPEFYLVILILAYQYFESYQPKIFRKLAKLFSKTAYKYVKERNGMWILRLDDVTIPEYLKI